MNGDSRVYKPKIIRSGKISGYYKVIPRLAALTQCDALVSVMVETSESVESAVTVFLKAEETISFNRKTTIKWIK